MTRSAILRRLLARVRPWSDGVALREPESRAAPSGAPSLPPGAGTLVPETLAADTLAAETLAAETLAARMPDLLLAAQRIAASLTAGRHGRRRAGPGEDFWQFRPAQPGEPVTRIDWRQSARSARAYVRETEAEAAQTVCLWCDPSASMRWRSGQMLPSKAERAMLMGLTLGAVLLRAGERVRLLDATAAIDVAPGGRAALERLGVAMLRAMIAAPDNVALPHPEQVPRHARVVLLTDGLIGNGPLARMLRGLAARPARAHLLLVNDPAEAGLPYGGRVRFAGLEDEAEMTLSGVEGVRAAYRDAFARHQADLAALCRANGHDMIRHLTDQRPEQALLALYEALSEKNPSERGFGRKGFGP